MGKPRDGGWAGPDQHQITRARFQPRRRSTLTLTPTNSLGPDSAETLSLHDSARRACTLGRRNMPATKAGRYSRASDTQPSKRRTASEAGLHPHPRPWRDHSSRCGRSRAGNGTALTPTHDTVNIMPMSYQEHDHPGPAPAQAEQVDRYATRKRSDATHDASRISPVKRGTRLAVVTAHRARTNNITMFPERSVAAAGASV